MYIYLSKVQESLQKDVSQSLPIFKMKQQKNSSWYNAQNPEFWYQVTEKQSIDEWVNQNAANITLRKT